MRYEEAMAAGRLSGAAGRAVAEWRGGMEQERGRGGVEFPPWKPSARTV